MPKESSRLLPDREFIEAIRQRNYLLVREMLGTEGESFANNKFGNPPLNRAVHLFDTNMVEILLTHGSDPSICDWAGFNALTFAALGGNAPAVAQLLATGMNPDSLTITSPKVTALYIAAQCSAEEFAYYAAYGKHRPTFESEVVPYLECMRLLIGAGADINFHTASGDSVIAVAERAGNEEAVALLRKAKGSLGAPLQ